MILKFNHQLDGGIMKQRAVYFTDKEWDDIKKAAKNTGRRSVTQYVSEIMNKQTKRDLKVINE